MGDHGGGQCWIIVQGERGEEDRGGWCYRVVVVGGGPGIFVVVVRCGIQC
jgi:hypothetical protein